MRRRSLFVGVLMCSTLNTTRRDSPAPPNAPRPSIQDPADRLGQGCPCGIHSNSTRATRSRPAGSWSPVWTPDRIAHGGLLLVASVGDISRPTRALDNLPVPAPRYEFARKKKGTRAAASRTLNKEGDDLLEGPEITFAEAVLDNGRSAPAPSGSRPAVSPSRRRAPSPPTSTRRRCSCRPPAPSKHPARASTSSR